MAGWPYNTRRWRRLRALQLARDPMCRYCADIGQTTVADTVDHVIPVKQDKGLAFELSNLQSMCASCHSGAKRTEENRGERIGCDENGIPLKGWD